MPVSAEGWLLLWTHTDLIGNTALALQSKVQVGQFLCVILGTVLPYNVPCGRTTCTCR